MSSRDSKLPKPMKATEKLRSNTTNESPNTGKIIDYGLAYTLQRNSKNKKFFSFLFNKSFFMIKDICLQDAYRSSTKEMIDIVSRYSARIQQWQKKWLGFCEDNKSRIADCERIWHIFGVSLSSIDDYIDKINNIMENLTRMQELIPKPEKQQKFKSKINQARANVDKLTEQIKQLDEQKENLGTKINGLKTSSSSNLLNCVMPQTSHESFIQRQTSVDASIRTMKRSLQRRTESFCEKQVELYEEWKKDELQRCKLLTKQSSTFLRLFDINSDSFNALLGDYNAKNDFNRWEKEIFYPNVNQSRKCRATENEVSSNEDESE